MGVFAYVRTSGGEEFASFCCGTRAVHGGVGWGAIASWLMLRNTWGGVGCDSMLFADGAKSWRKAAESSGLRFVSVNPSLLKLT